MCFTTLEFSENDKIKNVFSQDVSIKSFLKNVHFQNNKIKVVTSLFQTFFLE